MLNMQKGIIKQATFLRESNPIKLDISMDIVKNKLMNRIGDFWKYIVFIKYEKLEIAKQTSIMKNIIKIKPIINLKILPPKYSEIFIKLEFEKFLNNLLIIKQKTKAIVLTKIKFIIAPVPTDKT